MKPIQYPTLSLIVIASLFFSCQRQLENYLPVSLEQKLATAPPASAGPDRIIVTGLEGMVFDENSQPLADAVVTAGGTSTTTNEFGVFRFHSIAVSEQSTVVKVEKPGYFNGSRTVISRTGTNSFLKIKLMPKKFRGSFNADHPAIVNIGSLAIIYFQANSIVASNGNAYTGKVFVYGAPIDPLADDLGLIMPGDLRGVTSGNANTALRTYGMLGVELETEDGQHLQLAVGKPAQINMTIPPAAVASAPTEIPLWHFDEIKGQWKEEGKAIRKANSYLGSVAHFSFWNFDVPEDYVFVSVQLRGAKASPVSYTPVKIIDSRNGSYLSVYTDLTGYLRTWVPKGAPVEIQVLNDCGEIMLAKKVGPFTTDKEIGTLMVHPETVVAIEGRAVNCDGSVVSTGVVSLYSGGLYYGAEIVDGDFVVLLSDCGTDPGSAKLYVTDGISHRKSNWLSVPLNGHAINVGELKACEIEPSGFALSR